MRFLFSALFSVFLLFVSPAWADAGVGDDAPALTATTRDGQKFDLSALKGKVVVVNFWASWCVPCGAQMPVLEALWRQYHSQGLEVLSVNVDGASTRKVLKDIVKVFTLPIATLNNVGKNDLAVVDSVPKLFVIGKDGKVKKVLNGPSQTITEAGFGAELKELIEAKEPKPDEKPAEKTEEKKEEKKE
ncbi:MAG: TlpA disulfide reductase family protein [Alphaproteobacteria bacterium]|nr:TlpA disulfide reductase family protein [Alphaproteobacteria bacterium]